MLIEKTCNKFFLKIVKKKKKTVNIIVVCLLHTRLWGKTFCSCEQSDSNRPCCSKYDNTSDDAPRSHQFDVEYHAHPSCSGRRRQSAMESTEPIFNEYPTDDQATTSGVGSGGDSGTSSDDLSAPSTSAAAASAAPLPWRGSRCIGKGYRANSGSSSVGSGAETTDGMWPTTGSHVQRECLLCLQDISSDQYPKLLTCPHSACVTCFKQYLAMEISESRVNITCPKCNELMHPNGELLNYLTKCA